MSPDVPTAILALVFVLALLAMRRGWTRRAARTAVADADPASALPGPGEHALGTSRTVPVPAGYAGTTRSGDWLDRVAAHGLGGPANATVQVFGGGVRVQRPGLEDLVLPAADLRGARRAAGLAGRVVGGARMVVIAWRQGDQELETGLVPRYRVDRPLLVAAVNDLTQAENHPTGTANQPAGTVTHPTAAVNDLTGTADDPTRTDPADVAKETPR